MKIYYNYKNLRIVRNFGEINKNDYILMVNTEQTRRKFFNTFDDNALLLYFARNWKIVKFVFGDSLR